MSIEPLRHLMVFSVTMVFYSVSLYGASTFLLNDNSGLVLAFGISLLLAGVRAVFAFVPFGSIFAVLITIGIIKIAYETNKTYSFSIGLIASLMAEGGAFLITMV